MRSWDSWKLHLPGARRPRRSRSASNSSETSRDSNGSSHSSEDQFVFSPLNTPGRQEAPPQLTSSGYAPKTSAFKDDLLVPRTTNTRPHESTAVSTSTTDPRASPIVKANPVVIEQPAGPQVDPASASTADPPEPLSARGDIAGGYFPPYEDPKSRVKFPHPFHADTDMAREVSIRRAAESSKAPSKLHHLDPKQMTEKSKSPISKPESSMVSPYTPLSAYNPIGVHDGVVLPLGKYYPSNWEKRHQQPSQLRPSAQQPTSSVIRSEPQVPTYHGEQGSARSGSEAQRRLQQYQRDMVAQAAMAASAILASSGSAPSSATGSSPSGIALAKAQLGANFLRTHKPISPRLRPLGSPGPVTPMSLEDECYMTLRPSRSGVDAEERVTGPAHSKVGGHQKDSCSSPIGLSTVSV